MEKLDSLDQHHVTSKTQQALPYPICHLKGIQCKLLSRAFFNLAVDLCLMSGTSSKYKGWYTWFITPENVSPMKWLKYSILFCFTAKLCSLAQVTRYFWTVFHNRGDCLIWKDNEMKQTNKIRFWLLLQSSGLSIHLWSVSDTSFICSSQTVYEVLDSVEIPLKEHMVSFSCPITTMQH